MSSNVPNLQITANGVAVPSAVSIRTGILNDTNAAFGGELDIVTPSTPQAHLADQLTATITSANAQIAYMVSQVDPATAEGRMQDAIGRIYFLDRIGARSSAVPVEVNLQANVVMPAGQLMEDDSGNIWISDGIATAPAGGGSVTVQFSCQTPGPISLGIGELTKIARVFPGWDAGTNLSPATVGANVESRAEFEVRRQESVAKNSRGSLPAVRSEVFGVEGVLDVFTVQNFTGSTVNYGSTNYPLLPHSIYVGVVGGSDNDIARAIFRKLNAGCDMNGNTTVTVQDTDGYSFPYPEYEYKFNRPTSTAIKFKVTIANSPSLPSTIVSDVKNAIIATFTGANGAQRARIGSAIFASNFYASIAMLSASVSILQVKIGFSLADQDSLQLGIDQSPVISESDIEVVLA